jgi:ABC-type glycerol-3-phosphate transport system substrate-binding protein
MQRLNRRDFLKMAGVSSVGLALAACAAPGAAPAGDSAAPGAAPVVITLVESWFGVPQFRESIEPVTQAISAKMQSEGLNVELRSLILDQHAEKYTALYAAGSDFTMAFDAPWYKMSTLIAQGALAPLEGLVDQHGPQLKESITETIYNANFMNGHLFGVPAAYYYAGTSGMIFREDLREKYGADMPTAEVGWASAESFLQAVLDNEPDMLPFVSIVTQSMVGINRGRKGWNPAGLTNTGVRIPNIEEGFVFGDDEDDPAILANAEILRGWWEKGYINKTDMPSSGTSQNSQVDHIYPGRAASCVENEPDFKWVDQTKQIKSSFPDASLFGVDMTGQRAGLKGLGVLKQFNFIVFNGSAPEEQQTAGIEYFNWLAGSQDNLDLWLMGVDGVNYIKEDNMRFSEVEGTDATRNYRRQWYVSGMSGRYQRLPADLPKEAEETIAFLTNPDNFIFNPHEGFEPDTKALELDLAKLNAVYLEASHGLYSGQLPVEEARAQMKSTLDAAGRQEYKATLQAQLDAYIAANPA